MTTDAAVLKRSGSWTLAFVFNALLILIPVIGVNIIAVGYASVGDPNAPSAETLAETMQVMDEAFADITNNHNTARQVWAEKIAAQLETRNMAAARGFLLAAPQMLNSSDQRSIRAAAEAEPSGTADQRLLRAALLFVPSDIRVRYEASTVPAGTNLIAKNQDVDAETVSLRVSSPPPSATTENNLSLHSITTRTQTPSFSVLGTPEDLVSRSRDWLRGNHQHVFDFRLTGLAMASQPSTTGLTETQLTQAASILKTAYRSDRLQTEYKSHLEQHLEAALPDNVLEANLEAALADITTLPVLANQVQDAFAMSVNSHTAKQLALEFGQISDIANLTTPRGALELVVLAETASDISQARLLTQAGGDRAIALASHLGSDIFNVESSGMKWNRSTVLSMMLLVMATIILTLCVIRVVKREVYGISPAAIL